MKLCSPRIFPNMQSIGLMKTEGKIRITYVSMLRAGPWTFQGQSWSKRAEELAETSLVNQDNAQHAVYASVAGCVQLVSAHARPEATFDGWRETQEAAELAAKVKHKPVHCTAYAQASEQAGCGSITTAVLLVR